MNGELLSIYMNRLVQTFNWTRLKITFSRLSVKHLDDCFCHIWLFINISMTKLFSQFTFKKICSNNICYLVHIIQQWENISLLKYWKFVLLWICFTSIAKNVRYWCATLPQAHPEWYTSETIPKNLGLSFNGFNPMFWWSRKVPLIFSVECNLFRYLHLMLCCIASLSPFAGEAWTSVAAENLHISTATDHRGFMGAVPTNGTNQADKSAAG